MVFDKETGEILSLPQSKKSSLSLDKMQERMAAKSRNYWAEMRNNLALAERSDKISDKKIDKIRKELRDILDIGILNYPQTLAQVGFYPTMPLKEKKLLLELFKKVDHNEDEKRFLHSMAHKSQLSRKANWAWRIGQEATEKQEEGWYPFFVTLTVDPKLADPKQIWQDGREFRKYIRRLANIVCKELGHPPSHKPPYRRESNYVTYAGVIEHGKSREHHHGHFIIWMRAIPPNWRVCPNSGIRNPANRTNNECLPMRTAWPWAAPGLAPALYFRSIGDVWKHKENFVTPLKNGKPMPLSTARIAGHYITKYLQKEHKEWQHRMKATRSLGMEKLKMILKTIDPSVVEALTWRPRSHNTNLSLIRTHSCPLGLIRSEAKRQDYLNRYKQNQLDIAELLQNNSGTFIEMLRSVRAGARPERMDSSEFYDWVSEHLPEIKGYSETRLTIAHTLIGAMYPNEKRVPVHTTIGANKVG